MGLRSRQYRLKSASHFGEKYWSPFLFLKRKRRNWEGGNMIAVKKNKGSRAKKKSLCCLLHSVTVFHITHGLLSDLYIYCYTVYIYSIENSYWFNPLSLIRKAYYMAHRCAACCLRVSFVLWIYLVDCVQSQRPSSLNGRRLYGPISDPPFLSSLPFSTQKYPISGRVFAPCSTRPTAFTLTWLSVHDKESAQIYEPK